MPGLTGGICVVLVVSHMLSLTDFAKNTPIAGEALTYPVKALPGS